MTQKEKLIELLENSNPMNCIYDDEVECDKCNYKEKGCFDGKLADYLLANGVVVLPCKVGDTVYSMLDDIGKIHACEITMIILKGGVGKTPVLDTVCLKPTDYPGGEYGAAFGSFGKTVFLTREEAEKALEKRKGGDE